MKAFAALYAALDATTSSNAKLAAMVEYFRAAPPADAAWAAYFLAGGKPRQLVPVRQLREFAMRAAGVPEWLFEESYQAVGDLAETLALLLPEGAGGDDASLAEWMEERLLPLRGLPAASLQSRLAELLAGLGTLERFVCAKLITGSFRVGVSRLLATRALAEAGGVDTKRVAQRLIGYTGIGARPDAASYTALLAPPEAPLEREDGLPYPFFLAHSLQAPVAGFAARLGPPAHWLVEWKWDGIRAQLVRRGGRSWLWSRGEDLVTERFPELAALGAELPEGTVVDGEILVWKDDRVQPFAALQTRLGRKTVGPRLLAAAPVVLCAYDVLEWEGEDLRRRPLAERRALLERLVAHHPHRALRLSPLLQGENWEALARQRESARALGVEGMMLKARDSAYGVGRSKDEGVWWKWKIDPYSVDAVLIYAQRGHGRRASLYTDYTFAVWDAPEGEPQRRLVPFAKAYSGLSDAEIREVDAIVRRSTQEKFGPVRSVVPEQVFELGFEGIARSARHKSGVAVRFPRILRWRRDKPAAEADTLQTLAALLPE
ncbi:ATP-dependent DNA ligase [Azoarcus indigens]|uniref:DNA ligase (ATP) n=1 Tax=Azoarcus indigens TaxID=29545 RepID=A0A4R6E0Z6_9RHOO|nr:ATP-dependent DNA ligase [Azoarcus indigens]NMG65492.1 ATP-dependent DNA ligase [Azoarcus indigens]TDN51371.1 DNA ligase-1 [Azoarcus indigens]